MCIIVDNDVAHRVLLSSNDPAYGDVHRRLFGPTKRYLRLACGGQLKAEYLHNNDLRRALRALEQAGRAPVLNESQISTETNSIAQSGLCCSNDPHVIALARVSRARVLCSHDANLRKDFTDKRLLTDPRGKIYQGPNHNHLLSKTCS